MKVVHLSTYDSSGGAAIAAYRLHRGLIDAGVESRMLVKKKRSADSTVSQLPPGRPMPMWKRLLTERWARVQREKHLRDGAPEFPYHDIRSQFRPADFHAVLEADVVHLHWTCDFLDWPRTLPWLAQHKPMMWTFHDQFPMRGVLNYHPGGELPPAFARWEAAALAKKKRILDSLPVDRLHVIGPSHWMAAAARLSPAFSRFRVHAISTGLDTEVFSPTSGKAVREALGIPASRTVIGFVAENLKDQRKGMSTLLEALNQLAAQGEKPLLLTAGGMCPAVSGIEMMHLGEFSSERMLALFYNSLDVFVCPSLQDNLPNTLMEAMSCGVPVLGFDVGGIGDLIRDGETGWLIRQIDAATLAATLAEVLGHPGERRRRGLACRRLIEREFSSQCQASAVTQAYEGLHGAAVTPRTVSCDLPSSAFASPS